MIITGRRPLAGISDNSTPLDWTFTWTLADAVTVITATGQIVPLSGSLSHSADVKIVRDNRGNEVSVISSNEKLTIEVVAVPLGVTGANTLADVESAAQFPGMNSWLQIQHAPVIKAGSFTDAFNSVDWMYNCDGRIELASEGEWGLRFSCTRRAGLSKAAGVTI